MTGKIAGHFKTVTCLLAFALMAGACGDGAPTTDPTSAPADTVATADPTGSVVTTTPEPSVVTEPGDEPDAFGTDPCELLTQSEAETILGYPVERDGSSNESRCVWATGEVDGQFLTLALVLVNTDVDQARFDNGRLQYGETTEDLDIGDDSYLHHDGQFIDVNVLVGSVWFQTIATGLFGSENIRIAEEAAARLVAPRV